MDPEMKRMGADPGRGDWGLTSTQSPGIWVTGHRGGSRDEEDGGADPGRERLGSHVDTITWDLGYWAPWWIQGGRAGGGSRD